MGGCSTESSVVKQTGLPSVSTSDGATLLLGADEALLRGTERVLFVEDQTFVREVTGKILKSAGYRVLVTKSAAEASRAYDLASGGVDLLLSDVILPRENGRELARHLRRQNPLLRVLLITGYEEQMMKSETEYEFGRWLPKPFAARTLLRRVREVLKGQGAHLGEMSCAIGNCEKVPRTNAIPHALL